MATETLKAYRNQLTRAKQKLDVWFCNLREAPTEKGRNIIKNSISIEKSKIEKLKVKIKNLESMNNMRKVRFNRWIPREDNKNADGRPVSVKAGTMCWEKGFPNTGLFHQWGSSYEEFESGPGNYTVALVELPDGTIESVLPQNLKFETK